MKTGYSLQEIFSGVLLAALMIVFLLAAFFPEGHNNISAPQFFYLNGFFINITAMGDTIFAYCPVFFLFFIFREKEIAVKLFPAVFISSAFIQIIKNISGPLPWQFYFEDGVYPNHKTDEIFKTLISSHTAIAFTIAAYFSTALKNSFMKTIVFIPAAAVAYSRIYLAGNSISAILFGIIPAVAAVFIVQKIIFKLQPKAFYRSRRRRSIAPDLYPG